MGIFRGGCNTVYEKISDTKCIYIYIYIYIYRAVEQRRIQKLKQSSTKANVSREY